MTEVLAVPRPGQLRQVLAFLRSVEPRARLSAGAVTADVILAAAVMTASVLAAAVSYHGPGTMAAVATSVPLAARRRYPLTVFCVLLVLMLAATNTVTDVTFLALVIAGYSAAVHSRYRGAALFALAPAGIAVAVAYWNAGPGGAMRVRITPISGARVAVLPRFVGLPYVAAAPWRVAGVLVLVSLASIAIVSVAAYAADRIRRLQAEHEAATRRAVALERARIAGELHDVVTHNVSVMIVQAGAARQVLDADLAQARSALLAVEASGRSAMTELRHLLGLLSPAQSGSDEPEAGPELCPQPGLAQLETLTGRVRAAGLPAELLVRGRPRSLPPGLDLTAFRVVQEALTNVLKHAGAARTTVTIDYGDSDLVVDVANAARPDRQPPAAVPAGAGRGLLGLGERVRLYGGQLETGPRPGGGWRVRARLPADPPLAGLLPGNPAGPQAGAPALVPSLPPVGR